MPHTDAQQAQLDRMAATGKFLTALGKLITLAVWGPILLLIAGLGIMLVVGFLIALVSLLGH